MRCVPWFVLATVLIAPIAHADPNKAAYTTYLNEGVKEFAAGNWGEARLQFQGAHDMQPTARTFRGLGLCDYELRHYVQAIQEFEASLTDTRRPLTLELRKQIEGVLERARQYVARYTLTVPAGVNRVIVDGVAVPLPDDKVLVLDPGPHTLTVTPPGGQEITHELNVDVGAQRELTLAPKPAAPAPSPPVTPAVVAAAELPPPGPSLPPQRSNAGPGVATYIAAGLTGVFAAGIVGFGLSAKAKHDDYIRQYNAYVEQGAAPPDPQLKTSGKTFATLTTVSIIGASVGAAATITAWILESQLGEAKPASTLQAGITPLGAYLRAQF